MPSHARAQNHCTSGLVAMTSASHAEGRQFDPGLVYLLHPKRGYFFFQRKRGAAEGRPWTILQLLFGPLPFHVGMLPQLAGMAQSPLSGNPMFLVGNVATMAISMRKANISNVCVRVGGGKKRAGQHVWGGEADGGGQGHGPMFMFKWPKMYRCFEYTI